MVRFYIWWKGKTFDCSAKSSGRVAIDLKAPSPRPSALSANRTGVRDHGANKTPHLILLHLHPIKGPRSFAERRSSSIDRSRSGARPDMWPRSFHWGASVEVNLFLVAEISHRGFLRDGCHLYISSYRFHGQALW